MFSVLIAAAVSSSAPAAAQQPDVFSPSFGEQIARDRADPKTPRTVNFIVFTDLEIAGLQVCRLTAKEQDAWANAMHLTDEETVVLSALCGEYLTGLVDGLKDTHRPE